MVIYRICIGMNLANQALFIDIASMLWAASIEKALDADGRPIVPSRTECLDEGLVVYVVSSLRYVIHELITLPLQPTGTI